LGQRGIFSSRGQKLIPSFSSRNPRLSSVQGQPTLPGVGEGSSFSNRLRIISLIFHSVDECMRRSAGKEQACTGKEVEIRWRATDPRRRQTAPETVPGDTTVLSLPCGDWNTNNIRSHLAGQPARDLAECQL